MITINTVREMFNNIKRESGWNLDGNLLYGYFFTDYNSSKLQQVIPQLGKAGFRFVDILESQKDDGRTLYFLHVEREERHTPESLNESNQQLYAFANANCLDSYDGFDVGKI